MLSTRLFHCLTIVTGVTMAACSSGRDASGDNAKLASAGSGSESTRETTQRDPCSLITKAEADAILSDVFTVRPGSEAGSCDYVPSASKRLNGFNVKVYWKGGKEALSVVKGGMSIATKMMKTDEMELGSMMTLEPVKGLGDEAYFNPMVGSTVLKDDTLLEFDIRAMMWHHKRGEGRELWKQLVSTALARL
jgi:hypothetical protein